MKTKRLPKTDSIDDLAAFWERHDLTDFERELEEVPDKVFERQTVIPLKLKSSEAKAIRKMAKAKGVPAAELIRKWVVEKIRR